MRYYLYHSRGGEFTLVEATRAGWDLLVSQLEEDNRYTLDEIAEDGIAVEGSFEEGHLFVDDGGSIKELYLTRVDEDGTI